MYLRIGLAMLVLASSLSAQETATKPIVIAHRGASGYLPEHTEGAKVLAVAQGADYIEQDVVLTRDHVFVVCHDIHMQETTDVKAKFPNRARADGAWYFADFDWAEVAELSVVERRGRDDKQAFANRFPGGFHQKLMRLDDEIVMLKGLAKTLGRDVGIYVELKRPAWHREQMQADMGKLLLETLAKHGYSQPNSHCFIQCFEHAELKHLKTDLHCQLPLIALMGGRLPSEQSSANFDEQMRELATFAYGIGPAIDMLVVPMGSEVRSSGLVEAAHRVGMKVHPYTVRKDALPKWAGNIDQVHQVLLGQLKVDGVFTDFPDLTIEFGKR